MMYTSTRDSKVRVSSAQAITQGISPDGGLYVPVELPSVSLEEIESLSKLGYAQRAYEILKLYLTDFTPEEIRDCVESAYTTEKFSSAAIAPTVEIEGGVNILELWHGPTCAFKDMALQLLPYLLTYSAKKTVDGKEIVILVATSGDTGKAALEGFKDVPSTRMMVFYPEDGVSAMQKLQMTTQEGSNVCVCAIKGNFDDAQSSVKQIFTSKEFAKKLEANNMMFSSANSINWGRLVPQIVYYFSTYCDLLNAGKIKLGDPINVTVPTGNFGNILAAYYAKRMGLPIKKLICASNANNVLTEFLQTGVYNKNRDFYTTVSPSMDILISSNLERLLYHLSGEDDSYIASLMNSLANEGSYRVNNDLLETLKELFDAGCCDDTHTKQTIKDLFGSFHYLCDTHTAVAANVFSQYREKTGDNTPAVIVSTASPYKFTDAVLAAIGGADAAGDEFQMLTKLYEVSDVEIPAPLSAIKAKQQRFSDVCGRSEMAGYVAGQLGLKD